jgi:hypothetical protein
MTFRKSLALSLLVTAIVNAQSPRTAVPATGTMSEALVRDLLGLAKDWPVSALALGINKTAGGREVLSVNSLRALIAAANASAIAEGGKYAPPQSLRRDLVRITCGDADLGEIFDCDKVSVANSRGRVVAPFAVDAGAKPYRNALGAKWSVRTVTAFYSVSALLDGFTVTAFGTDGTEWPLIVSKEDV